MCAGTAWPASGVARMPTATRDERLQRMGRCLSREGQEHAARDALRLRLTAIGCETQPAAVGKDHVAGLPDQRHLVQRRIPQALMREAERIDPNDPCRLASRLSGD